MKTHYLYDVNTNMFVEVDEGTYQCLWKNEQKGAALSSITDARVKHNIDILYMQGFLSAKRPKKIQHNQSSYMDYHLNENIMQIALQVTQQCNFRCAYCVYCGGDFEFQRDHSSKRMSVETALAAIDFFAARCGNQEQPAIAFYGGEPLLEFSLIQKVTAYAEKKLYGKKPLFAITTNASLLTPDIARFFLKHNFRTTISLDGTPETHDRSRRFANNGRGSFDVICNNVVIDPRYPCNSLHQLFSREELFREAHITSTLIDDKFSIEKTVPGEIYLQQDRRYMFQSYLAFRGDYARKNVSRVAYSSLLGDFRRVMMNMKPMVSLPDVAAPGGPCIAGERRLLVSVDGDLYPCERVSETSQAMRIVRIVGRFGIVYFVVVIVIIVESCLLNFVFLSVIGYVIMWRKHLGIISG